MKDQALLLSTSKQFLNYSVMARLVSFSAPICTTNIIGIAANFFAIFLVAQLGETTLAASALATSTYTTLMLIASTSLYAVSILISYAQRQAALDPKKIGLLFQSGCWFSLLLALPIGLLLWYADFLLHCIGQKAELIALTAPYFKFSAITLFPILLSIVISQFFIGIGTPRFTLLTAILRLPAMLFFSYGFILGHFGLPQLGLAGVMAANCLVQVLYCFCLFLYLYFNPRFKTYALFEKCYYIHWSSLAQLFKVGMPIGIQYGCELLVMTCLTYFMGYYGSQPLAASQLVSQYSLLVIMLVHGLSQGLSTLISGAYSQKNKQLVMQYMNAALLILVILLSIVTFCYAHPEALMRFFIKEDTQVTDSFLKYVTYFFYLSAVSLAIDGFRILLSSGLRGLHNTRFSMYVGISSLWLVSLPMACFISFTLHQGPFGLSIGFMSGLILAAALVWKKMRQQIALI